MIGFDGYGAEGGGEEDLRQRACGRDSVGG